MIANMLSRIFDLTVGIIAFALVASSDWLSIPKDRTGAYIVLAIGAFAIFAAFRPKRH